MNLNGSQEEEGRDEIGKLDNRDLLALLEQIRALPWTSSGPPEAWTGEDEPPMTFTRDA